MLIKKFAHGILDISLTGDDCGALGRFLTAASEAGAFDARGQEAEGTLCEALASAFTLGALASTSHNWVSFADHDKLIEDLQAVGLGHLLTNGKDVLAQVESVLREVGD